MAKKRLVSTERKLMTDKDVAVAYQQAFNEYLDKKYKATTKVRIVFDGSAPFEGKSLNSEALTAPKLQSDVFDILVKFRKETVALAGDISEMYHQLVLREEDRPLHHFLWRDMDLRREPEVYEFLRFVFGGCCCPFCAHLEKTRRTPPRKFPVSGGCSKESSLHV